MPDLERVQPDGGLIIYRSFAGRTDWTKAWDTSACFGVQLFLVAMARRSRSSR